MADRGDIVARLREVAGPSKELDREIAYAVGWCRTAEERIAELKKALGKEASDKARAILSAEPDTFPPYTRSTDAAMSLYKTKPERVPSDPLKLCIEALEQW